MSADTGKRLDLAVVMPVYNEEGCIGQVVADWLAVLEGLEIDFRLILLNDGSRDGTAAVLDGLSGQPRLQVIHKANSGHGPTILRGYRLAVEQAAWVFQTDSDDEMPAGSFTDLWSRRDEADAVFGIRWGRRQEPARMLISAVSRLMVRCVFAPGVTDVNVPYRLIRSDCLAPLLEHIPADTFAPNVIIAGMLARGGKRLLNLPVPHRGRRTGTVSLGSRRLWKAAFRSVGQLVSAGLAFR